MPRPHPFFTLAEWFAVKDDPAAMAAARQRLAALIFGDGGLEQELAGWTREQIERRADLISTNEDEPFDEIEEPEPEPKSKALTTVGVYRSVAKTMGLKKKDVQTAVEGFFGLAAAQLKTNGTFKIAGMLNLKLKVKPSMPARRGVHPFTKERCEFKARPASKTVKAFPTKKFKAVVL